MVSATRNRGTERGGSVAFPRQFVAFRAASVFERSQVSYDSTGEGGGREFNSLNERSRDQRQAVGRPRREFNDKARSRSLRGEGML